MSTDITVTASAPAISAWTPGTAVSGEGDGFAQMLAAAATDDAAPGATITAPQMAAPANDFLDLLQGIPQTDAGTPGQNMANQAIAPATTEQPARSIDPAGEMPAGSSSMPAKDAAAASSLPKDAPREAANGRIVANDNVPDANPAAAPDSTRNGQPAGERQQTATMDPQTTGAQARTPVPRPAVKAERSETDTRKAAGPANSGGTSPSKARTDRPSRKADAAPADGRQNFVANAVAPAIVMPVAAAKAAAPQAAVPTQNDDAVPDVTAPAPAKASQPGAQPPVSDEQDDAAISNAAPAQFVPRKAADAKIAGNPVKPAKSDAPAKTSSDAGNGVSQIADAKPAPGDKSVPAPQPASTPPAPDPAAAPAQAAASGSIVGTASQASAPQPALPTQHVQVTAHAAPDVQALAVHIAARSQSGSRQFDIRLDPPELGRVDVRLSIDATGKVAAHLSADQPQTLDLLQKDSTSLTQALRDAGLNVGQDDLNFSLRQQNSTGDNRSGGNSRGRASSLSLKAIAGLEATNISATIRASDGRLDIRV